MTDGFDVLEGKSILVTGGTGSFGKDFVGLALRQCSPRRLIVFSRDEMKQDEMRAQFDEATYSCLRYFIGDVRDESRLLRAMNGVDIVIHAAALKQVPACEYNPMEAINTNIIGARNVIEAAIDMGVKKVIALSTDKAVNPVNLYGATKLCAEKLFVQSNAYSGIGGTQFSCVRYGNVLGSRGSVIPRVLDQRPSGRVTVTDPRMTRFWITLDQGVRFVVGCLGLMVGGEVFVPKLPSMNIMDLVKAVVPDCEVDEIGVRPGEKLHEVLISEDEARLTLELEDMFLIQPAHPWWETENRIPGQRLPEGYRYASDQNTDWLSPDRLRALVGEVE